MMKPQTALKAGIIISMAVVMIFLMSAAAPAMSSQQVNPATSTSSGNIQPEALLNTNATWSTFHNGWKPLEYSNGSANLTLQANLNSEYQNPITVNPTDIIANGTLQGEKILGNNWTTLWRGNPVGGGSVETLSTVMHNGVPSIQLKQNTSASAGNWVGIIAKTFDVASYPSNNIQDIYVNYIAGLTGPTMAGVSARLELWNSSLNGAKVPNTSILPGQTEFVSSSLASYRGADFETNKSSSFYMEFELHLPVATSTTYTLSIYGLSITTYPLTLGTRMVNGTSEPVHQTIQNDLSSFDPNFQWSTISNSGYTVSISQNLQNETTLQNAINDGNYIEQVEYQGSFKLPNTPDLSYGPSSLTEKFNISTSQVAVLDINGVSYVTEISGKNGTITLLSSVNPTTTTTFLQIIDYTNSQWYTVSGPPGFFSEEGFEYYFDVFILGIMALIGLGGGAATIHLRNLRRLR